MGNVEFGWDAVLIMEDGLETIPDWFLVEVTIVCPPWLAEELIIIRLVTVHLWIDPYWATGLEMSRHVQVCEDVQRILALDCPGLSTSELHCWNMTGVVGLEVTVSIGWICEVR